MTELTGKQAVDAYFATLQEPFKSLLDSLRSTIRAAAPDAEEAVSYGVPAFQLDGPLVYYAAFKKHCSLFPGSSTLLEALSDKLAAFKVSKGTIQFSDQNPLPDTLVTEIIAMRISENRNRKREKVAGKKR